MGRFDISPEVAEEWRGRYRSSVEPHVDDEKIVCDQEGLGDNPWADDVIRELQT